MRLSDLDNLVIIQKTILAEMIRQPERIGVVCATLRPEDFTELGARAMFEALEKLHREGTPVELATIRQTLGQEYDCLLEDIWQHSTDDLDWYIEALQQHRRISDVRAACMKIAECDDLESIGKQVDALSAMMITNRRAAVFSAADMAKLMLAELDRDGQTQILSTGAKPLDQWVQMEPGDFILLGGYPSAGKTAMALQLALAMSRHWRVGFYSLETSQTKAARRLLAAMAGIPLPAIKARSFTEEQLDSAQYAAEFMRGLQLEFIPSSSMSVRDIRSMVLARRHQVIFVDYLQIINERGRDRYEIVTNISQGLHRLAQDHQVTVIALAQLTRPDNVKGKKTPPNMASFRESGQIEQDADVAMLLYPEDPDDYKSRRVLKIAKNKEGPKTKLFMEFDGAVQQFRFAPESYRKPEQRPMRKEPPPQVSMDEQLIPLDLDDVPF